MSKETLGERLPGAIARIGRFLGSDKALLAAPEFIHDLFAIHAAASDAATEIARWKPKDGAACPAECDCERCDERNGVRQFVE